MRICNALVYTAQHTFELLDIAVENGMIAALEEPRKADSHSFDAHGMRAIPGLVDIHIHGVCGADFTTSPRTALENMAQNLACRGITSFVPTAMTAPQPQMEEILCAVRDFSGVGGAKMEGIFLEGPFISREKCGAQPKEFMCAPDIDLFDRWQEMSGGKILRVAVAPELPGALEFIRSLRSRYPRCRVAIAHTAADYDTVLAAIDSGADCAAHICNAMNPIHHRQTGVFGAFFDRSHTFAEAICDGEHISAPMLRMLWKLYGDERMVMVSDGTAATCLPQDSHATLGASRIVRRGCRAVLESDTDCLAGSCTDLAHCLRNATAYGISLESAVQSASENAAKAIGILGSAGTIACGARADLVFLDESLNVKKVMLGGRFI